jgi:hypothetical protein
MNDLKMITAQIAALRERIRRTNTVLAAIQEAAEGLAAMTPHANTTALLIASLAKEAREGE